MFFFIEIALFNLFRFIKRVFNIYLRPFIHQATKVSDTYVVYTRRKQLLGRVRNHKSRVATYHYYTYLTKFQQHVPVSVNAPLHRHIIVAVAAKIIVSSGIGYLHRLVKNGLIMDR